MTMDYEAEALLDEQWNAFTEALTGGIEPIAAARKPLFDEIRHLNEQLAAADARNAELAARVAILEDRLTQLGRDLAG